MHHLHCFYLDEIDQLANCHRFINFKKMIPQRVFNVQKLQRIVQTLDLSGHKKYENILYSYRKLAKHQKQQRTFDCDVCMSAANSTLLKQLPRSL